LAITIFVTSLAMNYVHRGSYFPEPEAKEEGRSQKAEDRSQKAETGHKTDVAS
jgi:hypothetical protein